MSRGTGTQADQRLDFPATTQPRDTLSDRERELLLERERVPTLRAGDLVVLDVALRATVEDDFTIEPAEPEPTSTPAAEATTGESRPATPKPRPPGAGLSDVQRELLETICTTLLDANPYRLDRNGSIVLPGVATIALAGLTEPQATKRLASEPALRGLRLRVTLLPVEGQGAAIEPGHIPPCRKSVACSRRAKFPRPRTWS